MGVLSAGVLSAAFGCITAQYALPGELESVHLEPLQPIDSKLPRIESRLSAEE
ncbi:MAG: hypothetical protein N838_01295 [Thiohalocapsa sp. PB-PSB1]|jgi:hypothetical protein|nr:MAG: hypothetical protein N838_01295 [Thiohalocapsa sp. PB-PSB1]